MQTLKEAPLLKFATGGDDLQYVLQTIRNRILLAESCQMYQEISNLSQASELTRRQHEWLRDEVNYTNFYGAVRIPYEEIYVADSSSIGAMNCKGEIRISFSGASQEQDVMFALRVLRGMQFYHCTQGDVQRWYNLHELRKIPNIKLWLDMLKIDEAPLMNSFKTAV